MGKYLLIAAFAVLGASLVRAQEQAARQNIPQWQIDAGSKMAFEVASVKLSKPGTFFPPNFPLDEGDAFLNVRTRERPNGRFSATFPLSTYISFAYKLRLTRGQTETMLSGLPKWVSTDAFEIQAHAPAGPTKDQMRLMMQALLAERFQLAVHFEAHDVPVLAMTLVKPGKTASGLRAHAEGPSCDEPPSPELFPTVCDVMGMSVSPGGQRVGGSRTTTMVLIAAALPSMGSLDRPVIDRTGLTGRVDFKLRWTPDSTSPQPGGVTIPKAGPVGDRPAPAPTGEFDVEGPTFLQALREQLGVRLESTKGLIETLVIDRIERPSEN
jgi:uncharacterized protein (TIGR03435 family)